MQTTSVSSVHCETCHRDVTCHYRPVNHWMQLLITLISFGMWLPIWMIMIFSPVKICDHCDQPIWEG